MIWSYFRFFVELLSFGGERATWCKRSPTRSRMETMIFARQAATAIFLVGLTLWIQTAGIATTRPRAVSTSGVLPLVLSSIVGVFFLLFGDQLFDGWLR